LTDEVRVDRGALGSAADPGRRIQAATVASPQIPSGELRRDPLQVTRPIDDLMTGPCARVPESRPVHIADIPGSRRAVIVVQAISGELRARYY